jgi:hypothetical protein
MLQFALSVKRAFMQPLLVKLLAFRAVQDTFAHQRKKIYVYLGQYLQQKIKLLAKCVQLDNMLSKAVQ